MLVLFFFNVHEKLSRLTLILDFSYTDIYTYKNELSFTILHLKNNFWVRGLIKDKDDTREGKRVSSNFRSMIEN